ncbi:MAG TPA: S53 family peptidase [Solirubrobacterales bacterium]|nr:S53 family peptidase [Solirubrobacterales bacterium]
MKRLVVLLLLSLSLLAGAVPAGAASSKPGPGLLENEVAAIALLDHARGLDRFVRAVSDPSSPRYREYATVEQLVARFGATPKEIKASLRWFARRGVRAKVDASHTAVIAWLSKHRAEALLPAPASASSAGDTASPRRVPVALRGAVTRIAVLDRASLRGQPAAAEATAEATDGGEAKAPYESIRPHSGTAGGCPAGSSAVQGPGLEPFTPNQFLTAYGYDAFHKRGLEGQGQTVALVEEGGFKSSDVATFARCFGFKPPPTKVIPLRGSKPLAPELEATLDVEMVSAGAPRLDHLYVYQGTIIETLGAALGSPGHRPDVISSSIVICEPELGTEPIIRPILENLLATAAAAGISVLSAAGDQGSTGCRVAGGETGVTALPVRAVSLPASSVYATAVGGTNLILAKQNRIKSQIVWNDSSHTPWAGGGGISILSPRTPWWQTAGKAYGLGRKVPDIAALADLYPGYALFCTAPSCGPGGLPGAVYGWTSGGGTSFATPVMAAGVALANQYGEQHGEAPIGFLNPLLYRLGAEKKAAASAFSDVVTGNNDIGRILAPAVGGGVSVGCCSAKPGYDWASGWGSLKIPGFAKLAAAADH